jgi:hypothetical protein
MIFSKERIGSNQPKLGYYEEMHRPPERPLMHIFLF